MTRLDDGQIEALLRRFLADEAQRTDVPGSLRHYDLGKQTGPGRRPWQAPRFLIAAAVAGLVVVGGMVGVTLSGRLPFGRADCSAVSIEAVTEAVAAVPGYTWHMTGTELIHKLAFSQGAISGWEYATAPLEFSGAYQAPDSWSIDILAGYDENSEFPLPPSTGGWLINNEADAYLVVGGQAWQRPRGSDRYVPVPAENNVVIAREANQLMGLLVGEPFRTLTSGEPYGNDLTWSVDSVGGLCRMSSSNPYASDVPLATWKLELRVDPNTLLPAKAGYEYGQPEYPMQSGAGIPVSARSDVHLEFSYDYDSPPHLEPPVGSQP